MNDLEILVRSALAEEAERAPAGETLAQSVGRRVDADRPGRRAAALVAAAVLAVGGVTAGALAVGGSSGSRGPAGAGSTPYPSLAADTRGATQAVAEGPVVTSGECAGLTVRLSEPDPSRPGGTRLLRPIVAGPDNPWTTDGNQLLYVQASGPCVDRLSLEITEPAGQDRVQGASGDTGQRFHDGLAPIGTHAPTPGSARVDVLLGCAPGAACRLSRTVVASVPLTITEADGSLATTEPARVPDLVTTTMLFTSNGTLTSSVSTGTPGPAGETVTVTVGP